eukprot:1575990-Pyramimonas_sp.AAC.1
MAEASKKKRAEPEWLGHVYVEHRSLTVVRKWRSKQGRNENGRHTAPTYEAGNGPLCYNTAEPGWPRHQE